MAMMNLRRHSRLFMVRPRLIPILGALVLLAGCAVKLVPSYDESIVEGLSQANQETLVLFAEVSAGAPVDTYSERESKYNEVIGSFDALRLQAAARPVPRPLVLEMFGLGTAEGKDPDEIAKLQNPTPEILEETVGVLTRMRDTDSEGRLSAAITTGFKNAYELSIDQALTVEKALER